MSARYHSNKTRSRILGCLTTLLTLAVILAVAGTVGYWYLFLKPDRVVIVGKTVEVEIPSGASSEEIASILSGSGVVPNANMFRLQSRLEGDSSRFRSGTYRFETGMEYEAVSQRLQKGPEQLFFTLTVPEGYTIDRIARRLENVTDIRAEDFVTLAKTDGQSFADDHPWIAELPGQSLEGYLFPKTYRVKKGMEARDVIEMMLSQFDEETAALDMSRVRRKHMTLHQVVTVASMVEREAKIATERPLVASVIYNRLSRDMFLGIDATLEYVLQGRRVRLRSSDLDVDTPYNTYRRKGLPPGPIASPGALALKAALQPADTRYLYYVLTSKDGSHTFTVTYAEFEKAKELSHRVFGK